MKSLASLLSSRKAWITLFGIVVSVTGLQLGISAEQIYTVAGLCALLVLAIASEDFAGKLASVKVELGETDKEKLESLEKSKELASKIKPKEVAKEAVKEEAKVS